MENKRINILHVFTDDKFFDSVSVFFDNLSGVSNYYVFYSPNDYKFRYIKQVNKISVVHSKKEYYSYFRNKNIDIIYFHSLAYDKYKLYRYIDKHKIVIWWSWGFDIYYSVAGVLPPLLDVELYKPETLKIINDYHYNEENIKVNCSLRRVKQIFKRLYFAYLQKKMVSRVNYFTPVLSTEYELLKLVPFFKANPFMLNAGPGVGEVDFTYKGSLGHILLGNSLTYTNNHFDILKKLKNIKIEGDRKIIIPVNYGTDYLSDKAKFILKAQEYIDNGMYLENFLSKDEYKNLYDSVSHIIMGHIRQQAIGNIIMAIHRGIKVFLYKDSIAYKHYKKLGYIVYSIEDDLSESNLNGILSYEDALHNYNLRKASILSKKERTEKELQKIINDSLK